MATSSNVATRRSSSSRSSTPGNSSNAPNGETLKHASKSAMQQLLSVLAQPPQLAQRHERVYQDVKITGMSEKVKDQGLLAVDKQV